MEVLYNNEGNPLMIMGGTFFASTSGTPFKKNEKSQDSRENKFSYNDVDYANWGDNIGLIPFANLVLMSKIIFWQWLSASLTVPYLFLIKCTRLRTRHISYVMGFST